jgi:hypothetical protein
MWPGGQSFLPMRSASPVAMFVSPSTPRSLGLTVRTVAALVGLLAARVWARTVASPASGATIRAGLLDRSIPSGATPTHAVGATPIDATRSAGATPAGATPADATSIDATSAAGATSAGATSAGATPTTAVPTAGTQPGATRTTTAADGAAPLGATELVATTSVATVPVATLSVATVPVATLPTHGGASVGSSGGMWTAGPPAMVLVAMLALSVSSLRSRRFALSSAHWRSLVLATRLERPG